jgi:hypothetical protein
LAQRPIAHCCQTRNRYREQSDGRAKQAENEDSFENVDEHEYLGAA